MGAQGLPHPPALRSKILAHLDFRVCISSLHSRFFWNLGTSHLMFDSCGSVCVCTYN